MQISYSISDNRIYCLVDAGLRSNFDLLCAGRRPMMAANLSARIFEFGNEKLHLCSEISLIYRTSLDGLWFPNERSR